MIAFLDPSRADAVIEGEGHVPVLAVLLAVSKNDVRSGPDRAGHRDRLLERPRCARRQPPMRAVSFYRRRGIRDERLLTDNGSAYVSAVHALACRRLGIRHSRTRPTGRRPTAKQSASFAPCSPAGPTGRSTAQAKNGQRRLTAGSGTTTIDGDTQPSVTNPRSAGPTCSGLTPSAESKG